MGRGGLEVELSSGAVQHNGGSVIGAGGVFGSGECAEPAAGTLTWLADLGHPFAPAALADPSVLELAVVGPALAAFVFSSAAAASTSGCSGGGVITTGGCGGGGGNYGNGIAGVCEVIGVVVWIGGHRGGCFFVI